MGGPASETFTLSVLTCHHLPSKTVTDSKLLQAVAHTAAPRLAFVWSCCSAQRAHNGALHTEAVIVFKYLHYTKLCLTLVLLVTFWFVWLINNSSKRCIEPPTLRGILSLSSCGSIFVFRFLRQFYWTWKVYHCCGLLIGLKTVFEKKIYVGLGAVA